MQSLLLRNALLRLRKARGLTQEQVARALEWSTAKIIRIEGGRTPISRSDLHVLLLEYGITDVKQVSSLQQLARDARQTGWWHSYKDDLSKAFYTYLGYEAGAETLYEAQNSVIPGLLQTAAYAHAYIRGIGKDEAFTATAVKLRLQRQRQHLQRATPLQQHYVLDEAAVRRRIGACRDRDIMPDQLRHLLALSRNNSVQIHVIPFGAGAHPALTGGFTILEFDGDLGDILYLEGGRSLSEIVTGDDERISDHRSLFAELREQALSRTESARLIQSAADTMK
ncbi:helix-turn-helix domain-containing protein [Actinomadura sp. 21ATH]|uniref:helix-turn-helix domain-containing protein n=1 Tax=Actinomadura sp. 21ATH TaxID=1735444 RepID=UPI0035C0043B